MTTEKHFLYTPYIARSPTIQQSTILSPKLNSKYFVNVYMCVCIYVVCANRFGFSNGNSSFEVSGFLFPKLFKSDLLRNYERDAIRPHTLLWGYSLALSIYCSPFYINAYNLWSYNWSERLLSDYIGLELIFSLREYNKITLYHSERVPFLPQCKREVSNEIAT